MLRASLRRYVSTQRTLTTTRPLPSTPVIVRPSQAEVDQGHLDARNLEIAVRHLHRDGLVAVKGVVPHQDLHHLNTKMVHDAHILRSRGENSPFNYNQGNLQQDAPPVAEYFKSTIFASEQLSSLTVIHGQELPGNFVDPIGTQITSAVLGPMPKWIFCSGNTAIPPIPGAVPQRQPVHSDADFSHPIHPFALVINVPLVTMTPENGSTELWLGNHTLGASMQEGAHGVRASGRIKEPFLSRQRELRPPSQPIINKGSIVIRDLRLWHAGMPNYSDEVRVMLAMIHFAPWYRNPMRLEFADDVKPILEKDVEGLEILVDWVGVKEAEEGYLNRGFGNSYNFNQLP